VQSKWICGNILTYSRDYDYGYGSAPCGPLAWISLVVVVGGRCALEVDVLSLCCPGALKRNETPRAAGALF
jgi:hypothetical protein